MQLLHGIYVHVQSHYYFIIQSSLEYRINFIRLTQRAVSIMIKRFNLFVWSFTIFISNIFMSRCVNDITKRVRKLCIYRTPSYSIFRLIVKIKCFPVLFRRIVKMKIDADLSLLFRHERLQLTFRVTFDYILGN